MRLRMSMLTVSCNASHELKSVRFLHSFCSITVASSRSVYESNRVLRELSESGSVDEARRMFDKMLERDEFTWNTMISCYSSSGRLHEARKLFQESPKRSPVTWSSLITGYCRSGLESEALELFLDMRMEGQMPSQFTLGSVLRMCSKSGLLRRGEQIHGYAIKTQSESSDFVVTGLVDMYAKCKRIRDAEYLFETPPRSRNHVMWSAMISGYSLNGECLKATELFREMRAEGVETNQFTFPGILTACAAISALRFGAQVHGCLVRSGFVANLFVQSSLVDMYAKGGDFFSASKALESMEIDDVISWNSMIVGCVRWGLLKEALTLFEKMRSRDMKTDHFTYPSVLNCIAALKEMGYGESVHSLIIKTGFEAYSLVGNALVDMYTKLGLLNRAFRVFDLIPDKDVISWTSLITGYANNGLPEKALGKFYDMKREAINPDQFTIASVLSACAELASLDMGQQIHANCTKSGWQQSLSVDNSLVTMYVKCGCIEEANMIFDSMNVRNVITWTALIVGYAQNGRGKESLRFYDQMIENGTKPDFITFIGLLFACSHAGLLADGRLYFESMDKIYGIKPGPEHYACMIDLLGRSGKLGEAEEVLNQMVVEPDSAVWKALLAACRVHGNVELGERAAKNLLELEPLSSTPYVLLSNMYSKAKRWDDVARVRRKMKSMGISKEPGISWIETNGKVHTFMAEDRRHFRSVEIYSKLDEVMARIKEAGYVPDVHFALQNVDEEGKEISLCYHSEKLAVSFALLVVPAGAPIRIFKNLRVCGDCHNAMKYVSRVYRRNLVLRDPNCFHHFRDGNCLCGDYW